MRYLSLGLYILLNYFVSAKEINIANCNELWDMTNSINKQPLYQVKIYSCIIYQSVFYNYIYTLNLVKNVN